MGYESRLYVVDKTNGKISGRNGVRYWADVIATFNLCKVYGVSDKMREYPETDCFIYADDGNTEIVEDRYGDVMKEIPIEDAIKIIEEASMHDGYRRYAPCLALLKSFDKIQWRNLVVLHYGY